MMKLMYFPVNAAWCFVFGAENINTASPITLEGFERFFQTKGEAIEAARHRGLVVDLKTGTVTTPPVELASVFLSGNTVAMENEMLSSRATEPETVRCRDCNSPIVQYANGVWHTVRTYTVTCAARSGQNHRPSTLPAVCV